MHMYWPHASDACRTMSVTYCAKTVSAVTRFVGVCSVVALILFCFDLFISCCWLHFAVHVISIFFQVVSQLCLDVDYFDQLALWVSSETLRFGPSQLSNRRPAVGTSDGTGHDKYDTPRCLCKRSTMCMISHNVHDVLMSLKKRCASKLAGHMLLLALVESFWVKYVQHTRMHAINFTVSANQIWV